MGPSRRAIVALATVSAIGIALLGVGAAGAQQDDDTGSAGTAPADLLARLGSLDGALPRAVPPDTVAIDPELTWGALTGDAGGTTATLATLEGDLRTLFVDADEAGGPVGDAVAQVARGWLELWHGMQALQVWETHDLAFPFDASDEAGVSTAADELYGRAEAGLAVLVQAQERLHHGYGALRDLGEAPAEIQNAFDERARAADRFDTELRPRILALLSRPSSTVLVPVERFETSAPGVEPRATSLSLACVDRDALEELGPAPSAAEVLALVDASPQRADCPDLPEGSIARSGR